MTEILWITPERTPYHDYLFSRLVADGVALNVFVEGKPMHPWVNLVDAQYPLNKGVKWLSLAARICKTKPETTVVVSGWHKAYYLFAIALCLAIRRRYVFWTDTPNEAKERHAVKHIMRWCITKAIFCTAHRVMSTGIPGCDATVRMGCPSEKIVVFPFFVPIEKKLNIESIAISPTRLFSAGRLINELKGWDIALNALSYVIKTTGKTDYKYTIAGEGPDRESLIALTKELGIEQYVSFPGWVGSEAVRKLLAESHALVHPARFDPFPVIVLEAMACGRVVLGSHASGSVLDRIKHLQSGLVHETGNIQELAEHIVNIRSRALWTKLAFAGHDVARRWPVERGCETIKKICGQYDTDSPTSTI